VLKQVYHPIHQRGFLDKLANAEIESDIRPVQLKNMQIISM